MYPPIFATCKADAGVTALLGSSPCRLYLFGEAPQNVAKPYAVWQSVGGQPANYLCQRPDSDRFSLQVDVYADTASAAREVAIAISYAIETSAHVTAWRGESREQETKDYRSSFDVDWFISR